jgi:phosphatidate cytidylyltransferase
MDAQVKRWITGVIAVPILFMIIVSGSEEIFALLILGATILGTMEYNRMAFGAGHWREKCETLTAAFFVMLSAAAGNMILLVTVLSLSTMAALLLNLLRIREHGPDMVAVGGVVLGILYVPLLMSHFILVRHTREGVLWIFFILILAFCGDIAAYYVGRTLGRRKLLPEVSPGKTVEGTIGLIAGSIAGCLVFRQFFFPELSVVHAAMLGLMGSIIGQLGDLSESALKRVAGVKDSGWLLPGHGGFLDRLDCLMFIAPFVYYYRVFIVR